MVPTNSLRCLAVAGVAVLGQAATADIIISEVHSTGSSNGTYNADFFEVTNTGASAVDITGWKVDDSSNSFAASLALRGVTSIGAGESVIFIETRADGSTDAAVINAFKSAWFGLSVPSTLVVGTYGGSGIGLGSGGDAVNLFSGAGVRVTGVTFGAATAGVTFDNRAGLATVTQLSAAGVNGAFLSATGEVGSPGVVPAPGAAALLGLAALGLRRRR
ncbi:MAG: lamin tail domain-containing protein [Tepidisphaera sp.]